MKADDGDQAEICMCYKLRKDGTQSFEKIADLKKSGLLIYRHSIRGEDVNQASQNAKVMLSSKKSTENVFIFQNTKEMEITAAEFLPEIEKKKISCLRCRLIMEHALKLLQKIKAIDKNATFGVCDHCILKKKTCCTCDETTKKFFYSKDELLLDLDREEIKKAHYDFLHDKSQQARSERGYDFKKPYRFSPDLTRPSSTISDKNKRQDMFKRYYDSLQKAEETKFYDSEMYPSDSKGKKLYTPRHFLKDQLIQKRKIRPDQDRIYPSDSEYDIGQIKFQLGEYREPELSQKSKQPKAEREFEIPYRKSKFDQMYELDDEQITRPFIKLEEQYTHVEEGILKKVPVIKPTESSDKTLEKGFMFSFPKESVVPLKIKEEKSSSELIKDTQDMLKAKIEETKRKNEEERLRKAKEKEEKRLAKEKSAIEKIMKLQQEAIVKQQQEEAALLEEKKREERDKETKEGSVTSIVSDGTSGTKIKAKKTKSYLSGVKPSKYELKEHKPGSPKSKLRGLDSTSKEFQGRSKQSSVGLKESKARLKGTESKDLKLEKSDIKKLKSEGDEHITKSKESSGRLKEAKSETKDLQPDFKKSKSETKELQPDFKKSKSEGDEPSARSGTKELKPDFKKTKSEDDEPIATSKGSQPQSKEPKSKELKPDFKKPKSEGDLTTIKTKEPKEPKEPKSETVKKDREQKDSKDKPSKQTKEKAKKSESEQEFEVDFKNIKMAKTGKEGEDFGLSSSKQKKDKPGKESKSDKEKYAPGKSKEESESPDEEKKTSKAKKDKEKKGDLSLNVKKYENFNRSQDLMILQLVKLKQQQRNRMITDVVKPAGDTIRRARYRKRVKGVKSPIYLNSELKLQLELEKQKPDIITEMIKGQKLTKLKSIISEGEKEDEKEVKPVLFQSAYSGSSIKTVEMLPPVTEVVDTKSSKVPPKTTVESNNKGVLHYALSDRTFIEKGWTVLPTEKVVRRMNVYRMRPAHPEFDWFKHNKNKGLMHYDTGERLAEIEDNGRGRWYYKNGRVALEYYDAEELNAQQRFVVYSNGEPDERGRPRPYTILATFDYLGNGIVFDHGGKIRLKYNQTEGVVLDRNIGPASHWKWHTLNDPPVLQQVMIDTQLPHKDPEIIKLGKRDEKPPRPDDEEMMAVEFDNFIKEKSKKLAQSFKPFQIKMKALKVNEHFSLKVLDQASVYLIYRDGLTNIKLNIGMLLDNKEIVDTDTAELGEVSNNVERFPARTDSIAGMQKSIEYAQRFERARMEHSRKLRPPQPCSSVDKLNAAKSRPLRHPLHTTRSSMLTTNHCDCKSRVPLATNVYYNNRLS